MKNISFLSDTFQFLEVKFSIYLNRLVFVMVFSLFLQENITWILITVALSTHEKKKVFLKK